MMLALRSLRSTDADSYIRLGTATMPLYHGVGVVTLDMTPSDSMHCSLAFTFCRIDRGTLQCGGQMV